MVGEALKDRRNLKDLKDMARPLAARRKLNHEWTRIYTNGTAVWGVLHDMAR